MKFIKLAWSFLFLVTSPMVAYTETFIKAKLMPVAANKTFVIANPPSHGIIKHAAVTSPNAISIEFL
jgi:hypothetical protein